MHHRARHDPVRPVRRDPLRQVRPARRGHRDPLRQVRPVRQGLPVPQLRLVLAEVVAVPVRR